MKMLIIILVSLPDIQRAKHNELYQKAWSFKPGKYDAAHWRQKLIRLDTFSCAPTAGVLHAKMVNLSRRRVFQDQTDHSSPPLSPDWAAAKRDNCSDYWACFLWRGDHSGGQPSRNLASFLTYMSESCRQPILFAIEVDWLQLLTIPPVNLHSCSSRQF